MLPFLFGGMAVNPDLTARPQNVAMSTSPLYFNQIRAIFGVPAAQFAVAQKFGAKGAHKPAYPLLVRAARAGLKEAQYHLGRCYLHGLGVPASRGEALRWFRRAAEAGEAAAQAQLAELALQGLGDQVSLGLFDDAGLATDFELAEHWCREAVAGGSADAKALLAYILTEGPEERRDPAVAEGLYREAAEAGEMRG